MRRKNLWKKALAVTLSASMLLAAPADVTFAETTETEEPEQPEADTKVEAELTESVEETYKDIEELESEFTFEEEIRAATAAENFQYCENNDGTIEITKYIGSDTEVVIPEQIDGKNVTGIGMFTFMYCSSLTSITIPEGVTKIGSAAFDGCSSLTSITIPSSVTEIEGGAFTGCSGLTSIKVAEGNTVYTSADSNCIIEKASNELILGCKNTVIPEGVTEIGYGAFDGCSSLTSITIPSSVTKIGDNAFTGCSGLTSIRVEEGNTVYTSADSNCIIEKESSKLIVGCKNTVIPASVTWIGDGAFTGCSSLTEITIPEGVTEIGASAFSGCSGLTSIKVAEGNIVYASADSNCLIEKESNRLILGCKNTVIPEGVTEIGASAFSECISLTDITIPEGVTEIGGGAFYRCSSLTSITIAPSVTKIGGGTFTGCSSLTEITIPEGVTEIGTHTFSECSSLTSITLPEGVKSIGDFAFFECSSLTNITLPERLTRIGTYTFSECSSLTSITIPSNVTNIGFSAFLECSSLTDITISAGVTFIVSDTFKGCSNLASIKVEEGNTVYTSADSNCLIEKVGKEQILVLGCKNTVIPKGVTKIDHSAFLNCSSLTSITIPSSVTEIRNSAFLNCSNLTSITIQSRVTAIGDSAFNGCNNLVISCFKGSSAHQYAIKHAIQYKLLDAEVTTCSHAKTEVRNAKSATCTEDGYTGDTYCKTCNKSISKGTSIKALGHSYTEKVTKEPTVSAEGKKTSTCTRCNHSYTEAIAKLTASYTVKFNGNGSTSGSMSNQKMTYGKGTSLSANKFKKTGYTFAGWNTDKNGKGTTYKNKADGSKLTKTDGKTVTLYAQWTKNGSKYTVTFNGNGSTSGTTKKLSNCQSGKKYTLTKNGFKKKGYTFTGWNTKKDGSGKTYKDKEKIKNLSTKSGGKVTLYAQWKKTKYKITYNLNKGTNNKKNPSSYTVTTKTVTLKNPTRKGYTFKGWYSDKKCTKKVTKIKKGSTGKVTLYAKWVKNKK